MFIREIQNLSPEIIHMISPPTNFTEVSHPGKQSQSLCIQAILISSSK